LINFYHILTIFQRKIQKLIKAKTVGVRTLVINERNEVLLVRHTYAPGWHFPGGGVDAGETAKQAALREAYEEAGIETQDDATLVGVYYHTVRGADDHVVLYVIHSFMQHKVSSPEIAELCWADIKNMPEGTTAATHRRLAEYFSGQEISDKW
jgi:mutator protein MutT